MNARDRGISGSRREGGAKGHQSPARGRLVPRAHEGAGGGGGAAARLGSRRRTPSAARSPRPAPRSDAAPTSSCPSADAKAPRAEGGPGAPPPPPRQEKIFSRASAPPRRRRTRRSLTTPSLPFHRGDVAVERARPYEDGGGARRSDATGRSRRGAAVGPSSHGASYAGGGMLSSETASRVCAGSPRAWTAREVGSSGDPRAVAALREAGRWCAPGGADQATRGGSARNGRGRTVA